MPPSVAIVMRALNEMPHVRRALDRLERQSFGGFELFAVDSGSTDGTLEALREHCDDAHLARIRPEDYAPGRVLNTAIARTSHPVIVLLNADAVPLDGTWLEALLRPILAEAADVAFSRQEARPDARFVVRYDYERAYGPASRDEAFFSAVACAFRRGLWEQHPFRPHGYAEDAAWAAACRADGARLRLVEDSVVEHSHNYTLAELYRKRRRQAAALGAPTGLVGQAGRCGRELARDLLHACRRGRIDTVPYNIAYRAAIHAAAYAGAKGGG